MTNSDSSFQFQDSPGTLSAFPACSSRNSEKQQCQNPRKKRSKLIRVLDDNNPIVQGSTSITLKSKYGKKPDPGAPNITLPCKECGKKFWSLKAMYGHMRCRPERQWQGINPQPNLGRQPVISSAMTEEDHEVAACLLLLSNNVIETESISSYQESKPIVGEEEAVGAGHSGLNRRFECSSCNEVFWSHQALGGHRASHKNVKGCFAITRSDGCHDHQGHNHNNNNNVGSFDDQSESQRDCYVGLDLEESNVNNKMRQLVLGADHKAAFV
ncbi:Zinc finger protein [Quillaja saponaria]|uniref:Zinc finger protein n=1 Tax=Quillaja saponaria TaxID=32244 RepID=A0AAD7VK98_QUISA|nr:Zinc finger protein [Quillaja saponaria]